VGIPRETELKFALPAEPGTDPFRGPTDAALRTFRQKMAASPAAVQEIYRPAIGLIDDIPGIRADIDAYTGPKNNVNVLSEQVYVRYTKIVDALFDAAGKVGLTIDDARLRTGVDIVDLASRNKEMGTGTTRFGLLALLDSSVEAQGRVSAGAISYQDMDEQLHRLARGTKYQEVIDRIYSDPAWTNFRDALAAQAAGRPINVGDILGQPGVDAWNKSNEMHAELGKVLQADAREVLAVSEARATEAQARARQVVTIALGVLVAAAAVMLVAGRSISRPLRRLAGEADDMADRRLPEAVQAILDTPSGEDLALPDLDAVPLKGGAEIVEVASALNSVQTSAAGLAVEQAALRRNISEAFVNLGRRNQNLLSRQLDSITALEQNESDPAMLERLFALDHLATRMRRNAESLLVLGGMAQPRQWSAPVPVVDAVRAALGEVEEYQRVTIEQLDDAMVSGKAVADLTHLLAELIENALNFSPASSTVEVVGRARPQGYTLTITDHGPGMDAGPLEQANRRIAGEESYTLAVTPELGHHVVGVQAGRLGLHVDLHDGIDGGLTAEVHLDAVLSARALPAAAGATAAEVAADATATTIIATTTETSATVAES
jgi:signal transduction histidine kinase